MKVNISLTVEDDADFGERELGDTSSRNCCPGFVSYLLEYIINICPGMQ